MSGGIETRHDTPGTAVVSHEVPGNLLSAIVTMAKDPSVDVEKLQALLAMQERLEARQAEAEYNAAFARLQMKLPRIKKNGVLEYPIDKMKPDGPKRKIANFAKWEDVDTAIRPLLDEEGFSLSFNSAPRVGDGGGLLVTAILRHRSGHATRTDIPVPLDGSGGKNALQGYGSSLAYGQRYSTRAALNLVFEDEDDDGARGGLRFITEAQAADLHALIAETGTDDARFCNTFSVAKIENLEEANYVPARNMLLAKRKPKA